MSDISETIALARHPRLDDCWNRIGIRGDGSCAELPQYVHCRNCPVHVAAAAHLLDREIGDDAPVNWHGDAVAVEHRTLETSRSILVFRIGNEWLGLPSAVVSEIASQRNIHSLPHQRHQAVLGLANIRGTLMVCMSLARLLNVDVTAGQDRADKRILVQPMLVANHAEQGVVFPVDEVHGIHHFSRSEMKAAPATVTGMAASYTQGILVWRDTTVGVLDSDLLFYTVNKSMA